MVLACHHIKKAYGEKVILSDVTFQLDEGEKIGVVGRNGCGKSTLLKAIVGIEEADAGETVFANGKSYGYLSQNEQVDLNKSIFECVLEAKSELILQENVLEEMEKNLSEDTFEKYEKERKAFEDAGGLYFRNEVASTIKGLGFSEEDFNKSTSLLSGGERTRVALAKILCMKPDILILDEPINHLDLASIMWLEEYLLNYKGCIILVAHDRYFIDKVCNKILEISLGNARVFKGNYTSYVAQKEILDITNQRTYEKQQKEIEHQKEVIEKLESFNREKSIKRAESRKKLLDKMDVMDRPTNDDSTMKLSLVADKQSGKDVLKIKELTYSFDDTPFFENLSMFVSRGERIGLIGSNGCGKSTLLKFITGELMPDSGSVELGANVTIAYYDQYQNSLEEKNTIFDELRDAYPQMGDTKIRNVLAAFLFTDDDVYKRISDLSGGEKGRVCLAKMMLKEANLLILDEPTNHLDIESKDILENALSSYNGTIIFVSHDRYFINNVAEKIFEIKDGKITEYLGNYDYYVEKSKEITVDDFSSNNADVISDAKADWKKDKEKEAEVRRLKRRLDEVESKIEDVEALIANLDEELMKPENASNSAKLNEITTKQAALNEQLEQLMEEWEELSNNALLNN